MLTYIMKLGSHHIAQALSNSVQDMMISFFS